MPPARGVSRVPSAGVAAVLGPAGGRGETWSTPGRRPRSLTRATSRARNPRSLSLGVTRVSEVLGFERGAASEASGPADTDAVERGTARACRRRQAAARSCNPGRGAGGRGGAGHGGAVVDVDRLPKAAVALEGRDIGAVVVFGALERRGHRDLGGGGSLRRFLGHRQGTLLPRTLKTL